jgi:hypothetical protein
MRHCAHAAAAAVIVLTAAASSSSSPLHPRLFFSASDLPALRAKVARQPFSDMVAQLQADAYLTRWANAPGNLSDSDDALYVSRRLAFLSLLTDNATLCNGIPWNVTLEITSGGALGKSCWGNPNNFGLSLYTCATGVALVHDWCATSWAADPAKAGGLASISAALINQGAVIVTSGGDSQNTSPASNWQGSRGASAILAFLSSDDSARLNSSDLSWAVGHLQTYLAANYGPFNGTGGGSVGWNIESLGYNLYPSPNFVLPASLALLRNTSGAVNLRATSAGVPYLAISPFVAAVRLFSFALAHADFSDDNANWAPEGLAGLAFAWAPEALLPGVRYAYDRFVGALSGNVTWDRQSSGTVWSILYYRDDIEPVDPMQLPAWQTDTFDDSRGNGKFVWRSGYSGQAGGPDIVAALYTKLRGAMGHSTADALGIRLVGVNNSWIVGGGRYGLNCGDIDCRLRSQTSLYTKDPDSIWGIQFNDNPGSVVGTPLRTADGSGHLVAAINVSNTGAANHTRRFAVDLEGKAGPGVSAAVVVVDSSSDGAVAQLMTLALNAVAVDEGTGNSTAWTVTAPDGATMRVTFLHPPSPFVNLTTGERPRAQPYLVLDGLYPNGTFVKVAYAGTQVNVDVDGAGPVCGTAAGPHPPPFSTCNFVWALTVLSADEVQKGATHPIPTAAGTWDGYDPAGTVTVGGWEVSVNGTTVVG